MRRLHWAAIWILLFLIEVESKKKLWLTPGGCSTFMGNSLPDAKKKTTDSSWRPYEAVDSDILQKARDFQKALLPLPDHVVHFLAKTTASLYLPVMADRGLCRSHSQHTLHSFLKSEVWALRMLDATSKIPSGVLDGRIQDLGNYDQCIRIEEPEQSFKGQHCMVEAQGLLPDSLDSYFRNMSVFFAYPSGFVTFSLCVPSSCDAQDIITHLNRTLEKAGVNVSTEKFEVFCSTDEPREFRNKDWGVYATIVTLVILSTWYERRATGTKSELLSSFSVISNWKDLKDTTVSPSDISCLNGLRVILAFFVMITHRFMVYRFLPIFNYTSYLEMKNDPWMALLWSSTLATEVFFLIAGVVRGYSFLRNRYGGKPTGIYKQYVQRYFRVTPSLAVLILFSTTLNIHLSRGPVWEKCVGFTELVCSHLWWSNLLHISNFLGTTHVCRLESWFLAADYQLFVFSPLLLLPLFHRPKVGLLLMAAVYVLSTVVKTGDSFLKEINPDVALYEGPQGHRLPSTAHLNTIYRTATFVVGLAVGHVILEVRLGRMKLALSKLSVVMGWVGSISLMLLTLWFSTLFMRPSYEDSPWLVAVYLGLVQRLWIFGFAWLVLACTLGYGGWLNRMLSWPGFIPLARLSFGIYLTHVSVQAIHIFRTRQAFDMDAFEIVFQCVADYTVSAGLAAVLYLAVEAPCSRVANYLLRPRAVSVGDPVGAPSNTRNQQKNCSRGENLKTIIYQAEDIVRYDGCSVGLCEWNYLKQIFSSFVQDSSCTDDSFCSNKNGAHVQTCAQLGVLSLVLLLSCIFAQ